MTVNIWKSYMWTVDKDMNMKAIFAVMNTTQAVVKIRPKKNLGLYIIWIYDQYNDRENLVLDQLIIPKVIFFLFSSLIWLILYRYRKEKFCLGHSWELKVKLKSIMFPQGPPGECRGKLWLCSWSQFYQKKNRFLWSCVTFANKLGMLRGGFGCLKLVRDLPQIKWYGVQAFREYWTTSWTFNR